ncbi:MAG: hypothetical protein ACQETB_13840, partial [Halobacteriota archaeon]
SGLSDRHSSGLSDRRSGTRKRTTFKRGSELPVVFVVEIKPSARKRNLRVGRFVNRAGTIREFDTRRAAESWADELTTCGRDRVWIQSAHPLDSSDVDGYLLSRNSRSDLDGAYDKRRRRLRGGDRTSQNELPIP